MSGGSKGTTTSSYSPPPEIMDAYKRAVQMAGNAASTPFTPYGGEMVAGLNATQKAGIQNVNNAQGMYLPYMGKATELAQQAASTYNPANVGQYMSPYIKNVAQATQANILEQNAQQQQALKSGALQSGAFGGDRSGVAMGELARQQGLAGGQTMAELYNTGYQNALQSMQQQVSNLFQGSTQMAGLGQQAQQQALQGAQAQMAAGGIQQTTQQAYDQSQYNQFMQQQAYPFQLAQFFANIAEGIGAGAGGTSTTSVPAPDPSSMILGGLGSIASIWSASDERVKEDIEPIGQTFDGQNIYKYRLKGSPKTQIGLMAQEVEHKRPDAVADFGGLKAVDYDRATEGAASMGGAVASGLGARQHFASGGLGMIPYEDFADDSIGGMSYIPKNVKFRGGSNIPDAPKGYEDKGLSDPWSEIKSMNQKQLAALKEGAQAIGTGVQHFFTSDLGWADGGLVRGHYADGGASYPSRQEIEDYINSASTDREIDPTVALKVAQSEGLNANPKDGWQSNVVNPKTGKREDSYGVYQLNMQPGAVGDQMLKKTGEDPRDPANWQHSIDYALDTAKKGGWSPWNGAKASGVDPWEGINAHFDPKTNAVITPTADDSVKAGAAAGQALAQSQKGAEFGSEEHHRNLIETVLNRDLSDNAKQAILAASLALMGGRSPWLGVNLGEAGRVGMSTYYNTMAQERDAAVKMAEVGRTTAEAEKTGAEARQVNVNIGLGLYDRWLRYRTSAQLSGQPFLPFEEYKRGIINTSGLDGNSNSLDPNGPSAPVEPVTETPLDSSGKAMTPVLSTEDKPVAQGSLPYWQGILNQASQILQDPNATQNPEQAKAVQDRMAIAQEAIGKIQGTDFYKSAEDFQTQYSNQRESLLRLSKLYEDYTGGRAAGSMADIVGTLQSLGVDVPKEWANDPGKYDEAMKLGFSQIINQTLTSGLLRAPGKALDAEQKIAPLPNLDPVARYQMIRKTMAGLDYMHDMYGTWDQTLNTLGHIQKFDKEHPFKKYYEATGPGGSSQVATPKLFDGQTLPGQENKAANEISDDKAIQTLNAHFGDAKEGTQKWLGSRAFIRRNGEWVRAQ